MYFQAEDLVQTFAFGYIPSNKIYIWLYMTKHEPGEVLETPMVLKAMHRRIIRDFLDVLVLAELRNGPMSGYDVMIFIHSKFRLLFSSGTVYSKLYSLERSGLISGSSNQRKRIYRLTKKGEKTIKTIMNDNDKIRYLMSSLLKIKSDCLVDNNY